ncbi:MAG: response regulator [Planctomycetota bacterium]
MELKRILVVDDEPHIRKVVSDVLRKDESYTVEVAADGEDAIEMLKGNDYACDLVITDMMMPKVSGYELICHLQEAAPRICSIVLTAHRNDQNVLRCLDAGAIDYLVKPISVPKLQETVRRGLERQERFQGDQNEFAVTQEMQGWVELTAPSDFEYVERFQKFTAQLGNTPLADDEREDLRVAIDELGQNAIEWGNRDDRNKQIRLSYCIFHDRIVFKVIDEGEGFEPENLRDPSVDPLQHIMARMAEGKRAGGYGVYITGQLMDEVVYNEKGNCVILTKLLKK